MKLKQTKLKIEFQLYSNFLKNKNKVVVRFFVLNERLLILKKKIMTMKFIVKAERLNIK